MPRMHLVELEDLCWWPNVLRNATTEFLQCIIRVTRLYAPIAPRLAAALRASGSVEVLDLCSGAAGPWRSLLPQLAEHGSDVRVRLTDKFPNVVAFQDVQGRMGRGVRYERGSVDATAVPSRLPGFRTLFTAFHHFRPHVARAILVDAVRQRQGIAVFEFTSRSLRSLLIILLSPLVLLLVAPCIRPFRWSRLFWTYVVPLMPLALLFDGVISCFRTYSTTELQDMAQTLDAPGYDWQIGRETRGLAEITYLVGIPPRGPCICQKPVKERRSRISRPVSAAELRVNDGGELRGSLQNSVR